MGGPDQRARRVWKSATKSSTDNDHHHHQCPSVVATSNADGSFDMAVVGREDETEECFHVQLDTFAKHNEPSTNVNNENMLQVLVNGTQRIRLTAAIHRKNDDEFQIRMWPESGVDARTSWSIDLFHPLYVDPSDAMSNDQQQEGPSSCLVPAPMPGRLTKFLVAVGDVVERGDTLAVMEAMKMEHTITAPVGGVVRQIMPSAATAASSGDGVDVVVNDGDVLVEIGSSGNDDDENQKSEDTRQAESIP